MAATKSAAHGRERKFIPFPSPSEALAAKDAVKPAGLLSNVRI